MIITSRFNNIKIKLISSWVDVGYENNGVDILITEKGKIILINWKECNREITLW